MNPANAAAMQSKPNAQSSKSNGNSRSKNRKTAATADTKTEFTADFVVGALLYSLLGSNRSEAVVSFLPEEERN